MLQTLFTKSRTRTVSSAILAFAIASAPAWAGPQAPEDGGVTGCLNTRNGHLRNLDEGNTPLRNCNRNETPVTLDLVGDNEVEPFAFALDDTQTAVIVESTDNPPARFSVDCAPGSVVLTAEGNIINGASMSIELVGLASENDLPVLLDSDGVVYSLHGVRAFSNLPDSECVVSGVVQHSPLGEGEDTAGSSGGPFIIY